jgi:hypothetical protein
MACLLVGLAVSAGGPGSHWLDLDVLLTWVDTGLDLYNVEQVARQEKDYEAKVPG